MIRNNLKILGAYVSGIIVSLIISLAMGALYNYSHIAFSVLSALITILLMYSTSWKLGRNDKVQNIVSLKRAVLNLSFFVLLSLLLELLVAITNFLNFSNIAKIITGIEIVWFYPFIGFYASIDSLAVSPVVALVVISACITAYYMGTKNKSILKDTITLIKTKSKKITIYKKG